MSAPNTTSKMPSASGTTVHSARFMSFMIVSLNHLFALASPNWSIRTPGYPARTAATASSTGCTWSGALFLSPFIANWMSTSPPFAAVTGARTSCTRPVASMPDTIACTAGARLAVAAPCTSTISCADCATPASASSRVAWPDSPVPYSAWVMATCPAMLPISMVTMTSSSHPPIAANR